LSPFFGEPDVLYRLDLRGYPSLLDQQRALTDLIGRTAVMVSPKGRALTEKVFGQPLEPEQVVERICQQVRREGSAAVAYYSQQLDGVAAAGAPLRVPPEQLAEAHRQAPADLLESVRRIRQNILHFQQAIVQPSVRIEPQPGVILEQRYHPLRRVGLCVPGGAAAYPSTLLMTAVPAQAAGVTQIAIMAPPTANGAYNRQLQAVVHELGLDELYAMGGAQGVAALAYGTADVPSVDKIVGPGNLFVALAKKYVFGTVDIDSIAGPSEVVVVADESTSVAYAAADMLAQAEHAPGSSLLVTWSEALLPQLDRQLSAQLEGLERAEVTIQALREYGAVIVVRDRQQAVSVVQQLAPEHLHIACSQPRELADQISTAGATFIGPFTPVAVGDYAAGPSHVLPTNGTARWASGLSANSFLRSSSLLEYSDAALREIAPHVERLAQVEGLTAHAHSVRVRL
jgi:histidinol dehydrogenase